MAGLWVEVPQRCVRGGVAAMVPDWVRTNPDTMARARHEGACLSARRPLV